MSRAVVWLIGGLILGGIVHIVAVLGVPRYAIDDPWSRMVRVSRSGEFVRLTETAERPLLPGLDPAMAHSVCRFSLDQGPIRIRATMPNGYWSLSLYDRQGLHAYGLDNRAAGQKPVDVLIASEVHVAQLREAPPEELEDVVIVDWKGREGFALLEALVPIPSTEPIIEAALATATCRPTPLP